MKRSLASVACLLAFAAPVAAEWRSSRDTLAWLDGTNVLWQFNYREADAKPHFHPLAAREGGVLTMAGPQDHPWHYGLWFSWKYINGVNYWEQDRQTGKAEGTTRWSSPLITTNADGGAVIQLNLEYVSPTDRVELTEHRELVIRAPAADGSYAVDWTSTFPAGTNAVKLDRTPMPGEPGGQVNGGYAGLSLRMAATPVEVTLVTEHGPVMEFASNRARPEARALAGNQTMAGRSLGAIAILSHPSNLENRSPWYAVISDTMRFYCSAILAPQPLTLPPDATMKLRYRMIVRLEPWTPEALAEAVRQWPVVD